MRWFTRSKRTLASGEVRAIVDHTVVIHLFVKRDDVEGVDFVYLGTVTPHSPREEAMPTATGSVPVVTMRLRLEQPVERGLYDYLIADPPSAKPQPADLGFTPAAIEEFADSAVPPAPAESGVPRVTS